MPKDQPGALTLFPAMPAEHLTFFKHLTAEKCQQQFIPEKGFVRKWKRLRKQNHWLDAAALCGPAAHRRGVRMIAPAAAAPKQAATPGGWFAAKKRRPS
jgi:hypothetical protein